MAVATASAAAAAASPAPASAHAGAPAEWGLIDRYCTSCHNGVDWSGGLSLDAVTPGSVLEEPATWESAIRKMRTGMMPPPGEPRPARTQLDALSRFLEQQLDTAWQRRPDPGIKTLHRLNRTEYANAIRDILALDVEVATLLPADDASEGFDNMADILGVSPTLIQSYVSAAQKISRAAVGDPAMAPVLVKFSAPGGIGAGQVEGLPLGTRGGLRVVHNFPLDAEYEFRISAGGGFRFAGPDSGLPPRVDVTLNGRPVQVTDPRKFRIRVPAGPQVVTVAMVDQLRAEGVDDLYARAGGRRDDVEGFTVQGPFEATGAGDTPSRRAIFSCRPQRGGDELPCARRILANLASAAYRVDLAPESTEVGTLLAFFREGRESADFDTGVQRALARLLVDPRFLYRIEEDRIDLTPGTVYRISDHELASRLSFFLWSSVPDARLRDLAGRGQLRVPQVLEQEVRRMLVDPRAAALVENFAGQWLHLRQLGNTQPLDRGFDDGLREAFHQETSLLFESVMKENRSVVELLDSNYTFLNERLARHYGIRGIRGGYMRRVTLPDDSVRRGLLGQGSILTVTSAGDRTSPVMRGAWVLETILGAHVPQPPPGVEADLKEDPTATRPMSVRERLEQHRSAPGCASCHQVMDPIGFAMENFDLIGRWREVDGKVPVNARDVLADGTPVNGVVDLRRALLSHSTDFVANISGRMLQYALGRPLVAQDQPVVRQIVADSSADGHSVRSLVLAIVRSTPFQMRVRPAADTGPRDAQVASRAPSAVSVQGK